jgi:N-methylhydantoinase A
MLAAQVIERAAVGGGVPGPAIINQMDTTTFVPPGWQARPVPGGALVLQREGMPL